MVGPVVWSCPVLLAGFHDARRRARRPHQRAPCARLRPHNVLGGDPWRQRNVRPLGPRIRGHDEDAPDRSPGRTIACISASGSECTGRRLISDPSVGTWIPRKLTSEQPAANGGFPPFVLNAAPAKVEISRAQRTAALSRSLLVRHASSEGTVWDLSQSTLLNVRKREVRGDAAYPMRHVQRDAASAKVKNQGRKSPAVPSLRHPSGTED
jgi:hypothetical protein